MKVEGSYESLVHLLKQQNCEEKCLNFKHVHLLWLPDFLLWKLEHQILEVDTNSHSITSTYNFANNVNTWSNTECVTS
jgi:hypothetical protein